METDGRYMMRNNYRYSVALLDWCQNNDVPFLYASSASVYGGGRVFREERAHEAPLNVYGYSKFLFDQYVRRAAAGAHRADRRLPLLQRLRAARAAQGTDGVGRLALPQPIPSDGRVRLFDGSGGYAAGEQRRDFVSVEDVVKVNLDFLDHPERSGIFNLGTGSARRRSTTSRRRRSTRAARPTGEPRDRSPSSSRAGAITYVPFPPALAGKYQSYTEGRPHAAARRRLPRADADASTKVWRAMSNG